MRHFVEPAGIPCGLDACDLTLEVTTALKHVECPQCVNKLIERKMRACTGPADTLLPPGYKPVKPWPLTPDTVRLVFGVDFPPERAGRIAELLTQLQEECTR